MRIKFLLFILIGFAACCITMTGITGCAQIGYPTGGDKDSLPPVLVNAFPPEGTTNFNDNKIVLVFDEYIEVQDIQNNLLVAPFPKTMPNVSHKLRTVTVKIKDSLLPNTTYAFNFGNSLRDLNEGNPFRNYTYVFSTGNSIDSLTLSGTVIMAESGKVDSTLNALLYKNEHDSAVQQRKPDYIARLDRQGNFTFKNLAEGSYKLYALKDGDGGRTYNSAVETFAFLSNDIVVNSVGQKADTLYAYAEEKDKKTTSTGSSTAGSKGSADKKLKVIPKNGPDNPQGLKEPFELSFNRKIDSIDFKKIRLTDSSFNTVADAKLSLDSTRKLLTLTSTWKEGSDYFLIIDKDAVKDTTGTQLAKADSIRFRTKEKTDYGNLVLRFTKLDTAKHIVLLFLKGEELVKSVAVTAVSWNDPLFEPGEYDLRILYDENINGKWDPGSYADKRQPERVITMPKKISVRAGWDNEKDIEL
jgi:uncharacterized protein (DUF2141 family)